MQVKKLSEVEQRELLERIRGNNAPNPQKPSKLPLSISQTRKYHNSQAVKKNIQDSPASLVGSN